MNLIGKHDNIMTGTEKARRLSNNIINGQDGKKLLPLIADAISGNLAEVAGDLQMAAERLKILINSNYDTGMLKLAHITDTLPGDKIHLGKLLLPIFLIDGMNKNIGNGNGSNAYELE